MAYELKLEDAKSLPHADMGYSPYDRGWVIPRPFNAHTHLRDPIAQRDLFGLVVPESAKIYDLVTAMPNLKENRIRTPEQAIEYAKAIGDIGREWNPNFHAIVPLYIEPDTKPSTVLAGFQANAWKSGKIYPKNGTTNSDEGVDFRDIEVIFPILDEMEECDMLCLVHGEVVHHVHGGLVADRKRESLAIPVIDQILHRFPNLRMVFEHISSAEAVSSVERWQERGYRVECTIAPQYLVWNSTALFEKGMNPSKFSIPILKDEEDREALISFMMRGGGMLGTDSAPHPIQSKSKPEGCAGGVFNEPTGLFVYFHIFRMYGGADWFRKFVSFACHKGREFYGEPLPANFALIREKSWEVPSLYTNEKRTVDVIPMFAGTEMPYSYELLTAE